jgi:hypothetical protein
MSKCERCKDPAYPRYKKHGKIVSLCHEHSLFATNKNSFKTVFVQLWRPDGENWSIKTIQADPEETVGEILPQMEVTLRTHSAVARSMLEEVPPSRMDYQLMPNVTSDSSLGGLALHYPLLENIDYAMVHLFDMEPKGFETFYVSLDGSLGLDDSSESS